MVNLFRIAYIYISYHDHPNEGTYVVILLALYAMYAMHWHKGFQRGRQIAILYVMSMLISILVLVEAWRSWPLFVLVLAFCVLDSYVFFVCQRV